MYQPPRREPEIDFEQILTRIRTFFGGMSRGPGGPSSNVFNLVVFGILGLAFVIWMATGIFQVSPGEQAIIRTFGEATREVGPGINWHPPAPIGTKNIESIEEIRSMELGFSVEGGVSSAVLLSEAEMIAGDLNVVDVPLVVQYRIKNLEDFLFNVADPGESIPPGTRNVALGRPEGRTLKDATEAALRLVVGQRSIDDVLTDNKPQVEADTRELLQTILDSYGAGIEITAVLLQEVKAPEEVRDAFQDVNRARQDQETLINQAEAFERGEIPLANGDAARITQAAEAFKQERIAAAEGEAGRFLSVLREYEKSKDVTRQRLYLEAMEEILPGISKIVISPEAQGSVILNTGSGGGIVPVPILPSVTSTPSPTLIP